MHSYLLALMRGKLAGRLLKYDPRTRRTTVLMEGINYANGVALSADESWVAVAETNTARVLRHWLRGPRAGESDVLVERLPEPLGEVTHFATSASAGSCLRAFLALSSQACICGCRGGPGLGRPAHKPAHKALYGQVYG